MKSLNKRVYVLFAAVLFSGLVMICIHLIGGDSATVESGDSGVQLIEKELHMEGYYLLDDPEPAFTQISFKESFRLFDENATGVILYSFESCPYCNRAVPILNEAAKETGTVIYYVNVKEEEMGTLSTRKQALILKEFGERVGYLPWFFDEISGVEIPKFSVPEVIAIKNGEVISHHTSLTDDFTITDSSTQLSEEQKKSLKETYIELINSSK